MPPPDEAIKFHGHLCPMFALGVRMGDFALETLDRRREPGMKLVTVIEFRNCLADGIQFVTGATYGKNLLYYREFGKFAASFYDLESGKSVRIRIKNPILEKVLEYGREGERIKNLPVKERVEPTKKLMAWGKEMVGWLEGLSDHEIFTVGDAPGFIPDAVPSLEHSVCAICGEVVLDEFSIERNGERICKGCL
jgi:formylmethanofuran dehydrogenase subunit E